MPDDRLQAIQPFLHIPPLGRFSGLYPMTTPLYRFARLLALVVTPSVALLYLLIELVFPDHFLTIFEYEGPIEWVTPGLFALSAILLFCAARISEVNRWCRLFAMLGALGSLFVFGEEVSWGQRVFGLSTPEYWQSINVQNEINLHNLWYFQGYRHLPLAAIGLAGFSEKLFCLL